MVHHVHQGHHVEAALRRGGPLVESAEVRRFITVRRVGGQHLARNLKARSVHVHARDRTASTQARRQQKQETHAAAHVEMPAVGWNLGQHRVHRRDPRPSPGHQSLLERRLGVGARQQFGEAAGGKVNGKAGVSGVARARLLIRPLAAFDR